MNNGSLKKTIKIITIISIISILITVLFCIIFIKKVIFTTKLTNDFINWSIGFYIFFIISIVIALTSIIIWTYSFIRRELKIIEDITEATIFMSRGDFSIRVEDKQNNEFGELTRSFNYLANQLEKNDKELNKESLKLAGIAYAGNDGINNYLVNPIDGDLSKLKNLSTPSA